jgi:DNA-binding CsgD family transcriptional regulator
MRAITPRPADNRDALGHDQQRLRLDELIRQLVRHTVERDPISGAGRECTHEEIMIDASVDGVRYLFVRMPRSTSSVVSLSPREQEIVRMVAKGYPNKTIAGVLNISSWTVCTHLRRIFAKLGVVSRAAMVARMAEGGRVWEQPRADVEAPQPATGSTPAPLRSGDPDAAGAIARARALSRRGGPDTRRGPRAGAWRP